MTPLLSLSLSLSLYYRHTQTHTDTHAHTHMLQHYPVYTWLLFPAQGHLCERACLCVYVYNVYLCVCVCVCTVFSSLDMSRSVSVTAAGQCRLAPLIQVILDSSHLYDYTVKLLFKLHSCESPCCSLAAPQLRWYTHWWWTAPWSVSQKSTPAVWLGLIWPWCNNTVMK